MKLSISSQIEVVIQTFDDPFSTVDAIAYTIIENLWHPWKYCKDVIVAHLLGTPTCSNFWLRESF